MTDRQVMLAEFDRRIDELGELARQRGAEGRWCEEARAKYFARYLRKFRDELLKILRNPPNNP